MKKKFFSLIILLQFYSYLFGQDGTVGDPFTTLGQALAVPSADIYYFNIGGVAFDTYVDANGYVLIAIDFGDGVGNLPAGSSLDLSSRGIMNSTTLASITTHTEIRISASSGNIDVTTTNATLLGRITSNTTLHAGTADNGINNGWTGTGATFLTNDASSASPTDNTLHRKIFHPSGNTNAFHWQPRIDQQRETHASGEIAAGESFRLWVRDNSIPLPIELLNFDATIHENLVRLTWQTISELNNDYFTIVSSTDGLDWKEKSTIAGAGNSSTLLSYSTYDTNPQSGISYYRLKQTDFNGEFSYSPIRSVNVKNSDFNSFQYLADNRIVIKGHAVELKQVKIYNVVGQEVTNYTKQTDYHNSVLQLTLDLSSLENGIYFIRTKTTAHKVYKN